MASAAPKTLELPPRQKQLYDLLKGAGDVRIIDMHKCLFGSETESLRYAQQKLGSYVTKMNRRLREHKQVVRPGFLKGTYRLASL